MNTLLKGLFISIFLFCVGLFGTMIRRNFFYILFSLEIMMYASSLIFVISGNYWNQIDGQISYIFIITLSVIESSIYLSLLLKFYHYKNTLNIENCDIKK